MVEQDKEVKTITAARAAMLMAVESLAESEKSCDRFSEIFRKTMEQSDNSKDRMILMALSNIFGNLSLLHVTAQKSLETLFAVAEALNALSERNDIDQLKSEVQDIRNQAVAALTDIKKKLEESKVKQQTNNEEMHCFG